MTAFKILLGIMFFSLLIYTGIAISNDGWNLVPIFLGSLVSLTWMGQFNLDFSFFLVVCGLWIAWRHSFSPMGIVLGLLMVGGMLYFALYLLVALSRADNDMKALL